MNVQLDVNAPILPWKGLGNIPLYTHIKELSDWLEQERASTFIYGRFFVRYEIKAGLYLYFNLLNGKLFKLAAISGYKGRLFDQIYIGQPIDEVLRLEPSFEYEDFEEVFVSPKGVFLETDPCTHTVDCISVFVKELETDAFERGDW